MFADAHVGIEIILQYLHILIVHPLQVVGAELALAKIICFSDHHDCYFILSDVERLEWDIVRVNFLLGILNGL